MSVIMHGNHYSIVFLNSWDVSGAMENVWNEDFISPKADPTLKGTLRVHYLLTRKSLNHLYHVKEHEKLCRSH